MRIRIFKARDKITLSFTLIPLLLLSIVATVSFPEIVVDKVLT